MGGETERTSITRSSSETVMLHTVKRDSVPGALEALAFGKPNKKYPTYNLLQKIGNKIRYLQGVTGYMVQWDVP